MPYCAVRFTALSPCLPYFNRCSWQLSGADINPIINIYNLQFLTKKKKTPVNHPRPAKLRVYPGCNLHATELVIRFVIFYFIFLYFAHKTLSAHRLNIEVLFSERAKLIFLFHACWCYADGDSLLRGKTIVTELWLLCVPFFVCVLVIYFACFFVSVSTEESRSLCFSSLRLCVCWSNRPLVKEDVLGTAWEL